MEITTLEELKMETYLLQDGETITRPITGNEKFHFKNGRHCKIYNYCGSTLIFYDEDNTAFVVPIPGTTREEFEKILQNAGYKQREVLVPLCNGFDYPELQNKWEAIKGRIKLIA